GVSRSLFWSLESSSFSNIDADETPETFSFLTPPRQYSHSTLLATRMHQIHPWQAYRQLARERIKGNTDPRFRFLLNREACRPAFRPPCQASRIQAPFPLRST